MGDKEDYLTSYRVFFENFAATVNPEDQLPVNIAGYTITESELPGEVLYWTTQYLTEKQCPHTLMTPLLRIILDEVRIASQKFPNEFGYKSDEAVYVALRLMQAVTAYVNAVCLRYLDNFRLDSLPPPPPLAQRDLQTVSCATKNSRRAMEDRHVEIGNLEALFGIETTEPTSFYAVYDGHAGSAAATYCAAHLHQYLVESPHFTTDLRRAMRDAFLRTDAEFIRKSNQERACGGSTAVAVSVRARRLLAAWAGDSQALLAKRMRLMQLVRPHKPGRQDERDRIESSGGTVMYWGTWRVNGQLAVSRAIGDAQYKPYVTARPEFATVDLDGDEDFVVVACDGLWDFVSEDDVALSVYRQLAADPDDLKAVTKRLTVQAKRQGSADNISIIVVFLKEPRAIVADNCPPMDLGLDNALANAPTFAVETDACKRLVDAAAAVADADSGDCDADADPETGGNGVDNSDSDSEDLGPETAVDADDIDADARNHEPAPPTPPAHTVEESHVDGALVDNVAESGEDSEDEWNYFKGEGEREENNPEEPDELQRSETPCQDNSAWETSSVDMNSSPLNPDAPVFVPGSVGGADLLLAESPRKPLPMDDIELPDVAQFETEAEDRPAELLDLDNSDQLNGHHNVSIDEAVKEQFNGNEKCNMDSLGFGFNVGIEPEKVKDSGLIHDFERIQRDTTDFCNIQVFQTSETNPFAIDGNDELLERLKNKERDPMSMSFYQEKDDDTCERLVKNELHVDLNAVQPLPDSDDEDMQQNGVCDDDNDTDKENISPEQQRGLFGTHMNIHEPNNDIIMFNDRTDTLANNITNFSQGDNFVDYNVNSNVQTFSNIEFESGNISQEPVMQTDTPESHKLLFEQIPEIPDGKSSELGFVNDDTQDPSESEKDVRAFTPQEETSQDIEMESKIEDLPCESHLELHTDELKEDNVELVEHDQVTSPQPDQLSNIRENEIIPESEALLGLQEALSSDVYTHMTEEQRDHEAITPEVTHDLQENVIVDVHQNSESLLDDRLEGCDTDTKATFEAPAIKLDSEDLVAEATQIIVDEPIAESPLPAMSPLPSHSPLPTESFIPSHSPLPTESLLPTESPLPEETQFPSSPLPCEMRLPSESPMPSESPLPRHSPLPSENLLQAESPLPTESLTVKDPSLPTESPLPSDSPLPQEISHLRESPLPVESPLPTEQSLPAESPLPTDAHEQIVSPSPVPVHVEPLSQENLEKDVDIPVAGEPVNVSDEHELITEVPASVADNAIMTAKEPVPVEKKPVEEPVPAVEEPMKINEPVNVPEEQFFVEDTPSGTVEEEESPLTAEETKHDVDERTSIPHEPEFVLEEIIQREEEPILVSQELESTAEEPTVVAQEEIPIVEEPVQVADETTQILSSAHELRTDSPIPAEVPLPRESPIPAESFVHADESLPAELLIPVKESVSMESTGATELLVPVEEPALRPDIMSPLAVSPLPTEAIKIEEPLAKSPSPIPTETLSARLERPVDEVATEAGSGPAPDVVPDQPAPQPRAELVTDIDIGVPESHAQEICVPVTSEIQLDEAVMPPAAAASTPPPAPAPEPTQPSLGAAAVALSAGAAAATAAAITATAVSASKSKTTATKKSPTTPTAKLDSRTPKTAPKSTTSPRTPVAGAKKPETASRLTPSAARPTSARTPVAAVKAATPATKSTTPVAKAATPAAKTATPASRITTTATKSSTPAARTPSGPASRASAGKPITPTTKTAVREAPAISRAAPKPAAARPAPAAAKPAPKLAAASRPAPIRAPAAAPARPAPAPALAKPRPKPAEKPLTNGDVKESKPAARPVPRAAPAPRAAPRPAPRATPASAPAPPKSSAPRPTLDKQSKDLANKRITAKAAPPRTTAAKNATNIKGTTMKPVTKKIIESPKKEQMSNGDPSPPAADNALLPDVIA